MGPDADQYDSWAEIWFAMRPTFLSMTLYAIGWLWGLMTGLAIVREAKQAEQASAAKAAPSREPPKLF